MKYFLSFIVLLSFNYFFIKFLNLIIKFIKSFFIKIKNWKEGDIKNE